MATLSPRELDIVAEIATGDSYKQIAYRMGIAEQTVKNHVAKARQKLGATSTIDLMAKMGWLRLPDAEVTVDKVTSA